MTRLGRILAVTSGLVLTGATVGAVIGGIVLLGWVAATSPHGARYPIAQLFGFGALFGAAIGAVLTPIASWTLLRRVPLGRAVGGATIGTALGAIAGAYIVFSGPLLGGIVGFVAAALYLRLIVAPRLARNRVPNLLPTDVSPRLEVGD